MDNETKVVWYFEGDDMPYMLRLKKPPDEVTLKDFKEAFDAAKNSQHHRPPYKYFFKSTDQELGVVKEEISDELAKLPSFNGRIQCWVVSAEPESVVSENTPKAMVGMHHQQGYHQEGADNSGCSSETESTVSGLPRFPKRGLDRRIVRPDYRPSGMQRRFPQHHPRAASSTMTSDLDTTSFMESEFDDTRFNF